MSKSVRDISKFSAYRYDGKATKLKVLSSDFLETSIQGSNHSSVCSKS